MMLETGNGDRVELKTDMGLPTRSLPSSGKKVKIKIETQVASRARVVHKAYHEPGLGSGFTQSLVIAKA